MIMSIFYQKAYVFVLAITGLLTFFTFDSAYNIGRLATISGLVFVIAHYISKDKSEKSRATYFLIASLIPLVTITQTITSENSQKNSLASINQSLTTHREILSESENITPKNQSNSLLYFSKVKPASSNEELLREVSKLLEIATEKTRKTYEDQNKLFAKANFEETLTPKSLRNLNGVAKLTASINLYEDYLNTIEVDHKTFNTAYKNAVRTVSKNYPNFTAGFEESFNDSIAQQEKMMAIQRSVIIEFRRIASVVKAGYENSQTKYDPSTDQLIMLNDNHLKQYNTASQNIQLLAKEEEKILKGSDKKLQKAQDDLNKYLKK